MKTIIAMITFLSFSTLSHSQLAKGTWLAGGGMSFVAESYKQAITADRHSSTAFNLTPAVGYFILDRVPVGIKIQMDNTNEKITNAASGATVTNISHDFLIGPFARYYFFKETNKRLNLFVEGDYGFGSIKYTSTGASNASSQYSILAGPVIFLNNTVGIELTIGYYNNDIKSQPNRSGIVAGLAFQVHLSKD